MNQYGIYQITIPLPFRLDHVHCYLAKHGREWTVIDAGLRYGETRKVWEKTFDYFGINPQRDISRIILTHHHPDHIGFAAELQKWTKATVFMSDTAYHMAKNVFSETGLTQKSKFYSANGVPGEITAHMEAYDREFLSYISPIPQTFERLREGQLLQIGELTFEVIPTPGHANGHLSFYNREEQVFLAGDLLLNKITPNISCHPYSEENPLDNYIKSLKRVRDLAITQVIPGHGPIFNHSKSRIDEIMQHHEQRLASTLESVKGEKTAHEVSQRLFKRELTLHELRFAIGETIAHLNYLVEKGEIRKERDTSGVWRYWK